MLPLLLLVWLMWFDQDHVSSFISVGHSNIRGSALSLLLFHILLELMLLLLAHEEMSLLLGCKIRLSVLRCGHISTDWAGLVLPIVHVYRLGEKLLLVCRVVHWLRLRVIKFTIEGCRSIITRMHWFLITLNYPNSIWTLLKLLWNPSLLLLMVLDQLILVSSSAWWILLWIHAHVYATSVRADILSSMLVLVKLIVMLFGDRTDCEGGLAVGFLWVGDPVVRR